MGRKIVLTGVTFTDPNLPKLATVDPMESAGSVVLIEPAHPSGPVAAGVPAHNSLIPNLLPTAYALADGGTFEINGAIDNGVKGSVERSSKGGIHTIVSQTTALANGDGARIRLTNATQDYFELNASHDFFVSVWDRLTRPSTNPSSGNPHDYASQANTNNGLGYSNPLSWGTMGAVLGSKALGNDVGPRRGTLGVRNPPVPNGGMWGNALPGWGATTNTLNAAVIASAQGTWTSFVFYRLYIEDLTVSGRSYAEVDAMDEELFTLAALTPGGRYYGDTFTDPATIP